MSVCTYVFQLPQLQTESDVEQQSEKVLVSADHVQRAMSETKPSVSADERAKFTQMSVTGLV